MSIRHLLNNTMTVTRPADATSAGTTTTTYSAHLSAVPCRWHRMSVREAVLYGAERVSRMWRASVEPSYDVARRDKCVFTDDTGSHTVYVIDVRDSSGGMRTSAAVIKVIEAEEIT